MKQLTADKSISKTLIVTRTFLPKEGGIEEYAYHRCLQNPNQIFLITPSYPGDKNFDSQQTFPIHRWFTPHWLYSVKFGGIFRQIINLFASVFLAIKLHWRYQYQTLEWCHGYDFPSLLFLSYLLPVRRTIYLHGNDLLCPLNNFVLRSLFTWTLQRTHTIVCNSSFTKNYLTEHFTINTPIQIIHPKIRPEKFALEDNISLEQLRYQIRQNYQISSTAIVILSVGRLVERKGFDKVIEHLPQLIAQGLDIHYIICGKGAMASSLELLARDLEVASRVHLAGYVSNQDLAGYYGACDLFVMLTFFNAKAASVEGFGIVYLEAGYFGKPVLASGVGGVVDAVRDGENGILVNPDSNVEIAEALQRLCKDKQLREKLGQRGRYLTRLMN